MMNKQPIAINYQYIQDVLSANDNFAPVKKIVKKHLTCDEILGVFFHAPSIKKCHYVDTVRDIFKGYDNVKVWYDRKDEDVIIEITHD